MIGELLRSIRADNQRKPVGFQEVTRANYKALAYLQRPFFSNQRNIPTTMAKNEWSVFSGVSNRGGLLTRRLNTQHLRPYYTRFLISDQGQIIDFR